MSLLSRRNRRVARGQEDSPHVKTSSHDFLGSRVRISEDASGQDMEVTGIETPKQ